jgi:hypothetical protein
VPAMQIAKDRAPCRFTFPIILFLRSLDLTHSTGVL